MSIPVLFRKKYKADGVTAVFPTLPAGPGEMTCYAHIGQHSGCTFGWYNGTRAASPAEYADLLAEVQQIYEGELRVVHKITRAMRRQRDQTERG